MCIPFGKIRYIRQQEVEDTDHEEVDCFLAYRCYDE